MAIQDNDIVTYKSAVINDTPQNGGIMSYVPVIDNVSANIFPVISQALRTAGSPGQWRKIFIKNKETTGLGLQNTKAYIENPTLAGDMVFLAAGTLTDIQQDISPSIRLYGCGWLNANASAAATSISVLVENGQVEIFKIGDQIRISDKATVNDLTGNEEYVEVTSVSVAGDVATLGITPALVNSYSSANQVTRVASLLSLGTIQASVTAPVVTSASGAYDHVNHPILPNNKGTVLQTFTFTFTNSTTYTIVGTAPDNLGALGNLGTGNVSGVNSAPINPNAGAPYYTFNVSGLSGLFAAGDKIVFTTNPSAKGIWLKRVIPANTASMAGNKFILAVDGESE